MTVPFRTWCAEKRDEAHRVSIVRMAREDGSEASRAQSLDLVTLNHKVRQTIADLRRSRR